MDAIQFKVMKGDNIKYPHNELKPCPFCGGEAGFSFVTTGGKNIYATSASCDGCDVIVITDGNGETPEKAINDAMGKWNKRNTDNGYCRNK